MNDREGRYVSSRFVEQSRWYGETGSSHRSCHITLALQEKASDGQGATRKCNCTYHLAGEWTDVQNRSSCDTKRFNLTPLLSSPLSCPLVLDGRRGKEREGSEEGWGALVSSRRYRTSSILSME